MKKTLILLIFLLCFLALRAKVTLFECIDAALKNSIEIKIKKSELNDKLYSYQNSVYSFLPSIIASKTLSKGINNLKTENDNLSITGELSLFDNRIWNYKSAKLNLEQSKLDYDKQKRDIIIRVTKDFLMLNLLNEKLNYYQNIIKDYKEQLRFTKRLLNSGNKTEFDLYSIEIELENNKIEYENVKNEISETMSELNYLTGLSLKNSDDLKKFNIQTENNLEKSTLEKAYQLLSAKILVKDAKINKYSMLTNLLPSVYLQGSFSHSESSNKYEILNRENWTKYWEVSLNFKFDFGNFLRNYNNYRRAKCLIYQRNMAFKKNKMLLEMNIENKKRLILTKKKQISIDTKKLKFLTEKFKLAQNKFKNGLMDFFMYKETANELLSAKIALINDQKDYLINLIEYRNLQGKKIFEKY